MPQAGDKTPRFANIVKIPKFLSRWIDRFYEPEDIDLVLQLAKDPATAAEVAKKRGNKSSEKMRSAMHRAFKRGVLDKRADSRYTPADFHTRYEIWALFEGWQDVPEDIRMPLNEWEMKAYTRKHRHDISALRKSKRDYTAVCPEYVLLNEAESLLEKVDHIYLWPCNCRAMVEGCKKPVTTCLRFSNDRGLGWEISESRAKAILKEADRSGLMHSAEIGISAEGVIDGAICNCCADCCFPHQLAEKQSVQKLWPLTRYIARRLKEKCTSCGLCAKRCPFNAYRIRRKPQTAAAGKASKGRQNRQIVFFRDLCRGCGLCATGCPEDAIVMDPLSNNLSLWDKISD
jgi:Pyruvate/2-oxoacid:ferredoxin oxidoreductase delta subunit